MATRTRNQVNVEDRVKVETADELIELRRAVIKAGASARTANSLVGWLLARKAGDPDPSNSNTRAGYRKLLAAAALMAPILAGADNPSFGNYVKPPAKKAA